MLDEMTEDTLTEITQEEDGDEQTPANKQIRRQKPSPEYNNENYDRRL